jgi:hypothetical protein
MKNSIDAENLEIRHEPAAHRFAARLNGKIAYLSYSEKSGNVLDYAHTYVPEEFRGQGVASKLTKAALDWADEQGKKIIPSCWFVEVFSRRHGEYQKLIAD